MLKSLVAFTLSLSCVLAVSVAKAVSVEVNVDGETYTCSKGGTPSVSCQCQQNTSTCYIAYLVSGNIKESLTGSTCTSDTLIGCVRSLKSFAVCN